VTKPFVTRELRARIKALLRRGVHERSRGTYSFNEVEVDFERAELRKAGQPVELTLIEFRLLSVFIRSRGRVLTREQLLAGAWAPDTLRRTGWSTIISRICERRSSPTLSIRDFYGMCVAWVTDLMAKMLRKSDQLAIIVRHWFDMLFTRATLIRARRALILTVLGTSAAAALWPATATGVDIEEKLEAAIHREIVLGDLKGAMAQYLSVIRESASKPSVARALYRYARCLEKLQRRTDAYHGYAQVVKDYSDQPEAALARTRLAGWEFSVSGPANLKFEQGVPGKLPDAWFVPALPNDVDHWAQLRSTGCMNHDSCAVVLVPENAPVRAGNLMQSFNAAAYRGKTVRLAAWLRLEATAPGDRGQMWLSVDRVDEKKGFFDDMSDRAVLSPEWSFREIRARIDSDATLIQVLCHVDREGTRVGR
jgi:hypothetical protein